jgi:hypothetical protein
MNLRATSQALPGLDEHQVRLWHSWKRWVTVVGHWI